IDILADLNHKLQDRTLTDLMRESAPDPMGFKSNRELATELFRLTGIMPYLGDRHTCEFLPGTITSRAAMEKYKLIRTTVGERREAMAERTRKLEAMIAGEVEPSHLKRSRETAADIISAHILGQPFIDVGNVPNIGQISNLPMGTVVETAVRVDRNGFTPLTFGSLPEPVAGFIRPHAGVFNLVVEACFEGNRGKALQALRLDPICAHLDTDALMEMGQKLLHAHAKYLDPGL
ncbi:MAG: hypothetical protein U1E27_06585, partial [Kiritimatiellia bacterium]|nr:hypothetical protein [Kiritimatiellia bacterium]